VVIEHCKHTERQQLPQEDKTKQNRKAKLQATQLAFLSRRGPVQGRLQNDGQRVMGRGRGR
jgi:hypothetical protein